MRSRAFLVAALATVSLVATPPSADARTRKARLTAFPTCASLVSYSRHYAARTQGQVGIGALPPQTLGPRTPAAEGAPTAPTAGPAPTTQAAPDDTSTTNVQEEGVDEPDIVKTDGRHIFAIAQGALQAIDARAAAPKLVGSLLLGDTFGGQVLLLRGDRALVISQPTPDIVPLGSPAEPAPGSTTGIATPAAALLRIYRPQTVLTEISIANPAAMRVIRTLTVDGSFVDARQHGGTARLVISSYPRALELPQASPARRRATRWLPVGTLRRARTGRTTRRRLVSCHAVRRPSTFSGLGTLTVLTIDLDKGLPAVDADALMTDAQTVYASATSLYVATQRWIDPDTPIKELPNGPVTAIHRFDASDPDRTVYEASGNVPGYLLNQFALSEDKGILRAATTEEPTWVDSEQPQQQTESFVTTLGRQGSSLVTLGRVGGLGRGERIRAVRFVGDTAYVVTFRQIDPLYTVDLSNPAAPKVLGTLELLGFSAYLHPIGKDLLLGVGQDATAQGQTRGTQLSLFDVSDLAHPTRLSQKTIGAQSSSEVEFDHHAFLYWPKTALAVIPVQIFANNRGSQEFTGAIGFHVGRASGIQEAGRVSHPDGPYPIHRAVVIGARLFTISDLGAMASSLDTLGPGSWVPFPLAPQPQPQPEPTPGPQPVAQPPG